MKTKRLSARVVAAYVAKNRIPSSQLPALIQSVHQVLLRIGQG
ncbi:MucR family transcriptional regulator [Bosea sp. RAF48]